MRHQKLIDRIVGIAHEAGAVIGLAVHDCADGRAFGIAADRWFHAASTIKIPILIGVCAAIEAGRFPPHARLHVRNRFLGVVDGRPYRISPERDANAVVHAAIGRTLPVMELARHMIVTSSNLATNLLFDLVGLDAIRRTLTEQGFQGVELRRGVEDEAAWEAGINNRVTAAGLAAMLQAIAAGTAISAGASQRMLAILHDQQYRSGIPAGLPDAARVAHKTGEISTVTHDAGVVYAHDQRAPYVLVVLSEWEPGTAGRQAMIARISRAVYEEIVRLDAVEETA